MQGQTTRRPRNLAQKQASQWTIPTGPSSHARTVESRLSRLQRACMGLYSSTHLHGSLSTPICFAPHARHLAPERASFFEVCSSSSVPAPSRPSRADLHSPFPMYQPSVVSSQPCRIMHHTKSSFPSHVLQQLHPLSHLNPAGFSTC